MKPVLVLLRRPLIIVAAVIAALATASLIQLVTDMLMSPSLPAAFRLPPSAKLTWSQGLWLAASAEAVLAVYQWGVSHGSRYMPPPEDQIVTTVTTVTPATPAGAETRQPATT